MAEFSISRAPASRTSMQRVSAGNPAGAPNVAVSGPLPVVHVRMGPGGQPQVQGKGPGQNGLPVVQERMGNNPQAGGFQVRPTAKPRPVPVPVPVPAPIPVEVPVQLTDDQLLLLRHLASKHLEAVQGGEGAELVAELLPAIDATLAARAAAAQVQVIPPIPSAVIPPAVVNVASSVAAPGAPRRFPGRHPVVSVRMDGGQPIPAADSPAIDA